MSPRVGGVGRSNFEPGDQDVSSAAPAAAGGARPVTRGDNFAGFQPSKVALATDGGPAFVTGTFNRSVYGDFTINHGSASFVRRHFMQGAEPSRKLTEAEEKDFAKALEAAIARGGPEANDLKVALSKLTWKAPTLGTYDFTRWDVKKVAIAADGGPVNLSGAFKSPWGPGLPGNITIRKGVATYAAQASGGNPAMKGKLTAAQEKQLVKALQTEIAAAKGQAKKDLQYALAELKRA